METFIILVCNGVVAVVIALIACVVAGELWRHYTRTHARGALSCYDDDFAEFYLDLCKKSRIDYTRDEAEALYAVWQNSNTQQLEAEA